MKRIFCEIILFVTLLNAADTQRWKLQIFGAKIYSEKFLIEQLDLPTEMDALSRERRTFIMKLATVNLDDFYQSNGYFSRNINLSIKEEMLDSILVETYIFNIYEGEKYSFRNANMVFAPNSDSSLINTNELSVPKGMPYDPERISSDQKAIRDIYQRNGYLHITLDHFEFIDTVEKKVDVRYLVDSKNQVRMGNFKSVVFRSGLLPGQTKPEKGISDTAWLNKLWEIKRDSVIDGRYFFAFRTKLFSTQLFAQIHLEDTLQENGLSDITLTAYERVPGEANYGFFFEQLYGFGISFSSSHKNLFGSFHEMGVSATLAENKQEIAWNYANPLLFGAGISWIPTAIRLDEKIFLNHEMLPIPSNPDELEERWEIANRANLTFGLSNRIRTRNTFDFRFLRLPEEDLFKIKGEIGLIFDFTDNSYDPKRGIRLTPSFGAGGVLENESLNNLSDILDLGITHGFTYVDASAFIYIPLRKRFLLSAFALSFGNVFNNASKDDARFFYQGGGRTLRGYPFRTVFPKREEIVGTNENGKDSVEVIEGRSPMYFRINEELRLIPPMSSLRNFQVVQFTDWARVSDKDITLEIGQEMSVGLGLRYKWQFLTVRLDYALKTEFKDFKPDKFKFSHLVFDLSQAI